MDEDGALAQVGQEGVDAPAIEENAIEQPISIDALAAEMGWTPQDKWHGDPEKWKPATDFVRDTASINKNLSKTLREVKDQVSHMARTSAELTARAVASERDRILAARQEAVDIGDREAFAAADEQLKTLPAAPLPVPLPEVEDFERRNASWYGKDADATRWAVNRAGELARAGIASPARQIEIVEREARTMFPDHFKEATPLKGAPLSKPGNRGASPQNKGFATLPEDVKSAALSYEKRGVCTKEEYAALYYEEGAGA